MTGLFTVPLGVIVVREPHDHPWEDFRWRTVSVSLDAIEKADWRRHELVKGEFHSATLLLTLHRKEIISYRVNLANGEPTLYVVLRHDPVAPDRPITVRCITASPFEAQSSSDMALDWIDRVPMPARLVSLVEGFLASEKADDQFATDVHYAVDRGGGPSHEIGAADEA